MPSYTDPKVISDVLLYELNPQWSQDRVTLTALNGTMGAVLGQITASGKFTEFNPGASDGSQNAKAVLLTNSDASGGDKVVPVLARGGVVDADQLVWKAGVTAPQKTAALAQLLALGIKAITTV